MAVGRPRQSNLRPTNVLRLVLLCSVHFALDTASAQGTNVLDNTRCARLGDTVIQQLKTNRFREAETVLSASLANGAEPVCVATIFINMAATLSLSGGFAEAERLAESSIRLLDSSTAPDDRALLRSLQILSAARFELRKTGQSRQAFNRMSTLAMERPEDRAVAHGMSGMLLQVEGRLREAELEYLAALRAWEEASGGDSANAASALACLASLYIRDGRLEEARRALDGAILIFSRANDAGSIDRINVLHLRSALRWRRNERREAEQDLRDAVAMADHESLLEPASHAALLAEYAQVLRKNKRGREARAIQARAAALWPRQSNAIVDLTALLREQTPPKK